MNQLNNPNSYNSSNNVSEADIDIQAPPDKELPELSSSSNSDSDSDSESNQTSSADKKPLTKIYAPDGGCFFEFDDDCIGHNWWFKRYEGSKEHLEFDNLIWNKKGPNHLNTLLTSSSVLSDSNAAEIFETLPLPKWKAALCSVLESRPFGLAKVPLLKKCYNILQVKIKDIFPYNSFAELLEQNKDLIISKTIESPFMPSTLPVTTLYFLANEATTELEIIHLVARLCHKMKVIVSMNGGIMKAQHFCPQLQSLFGLSFDPEDWGFECVEDMIDLFSILVPMSDVRSMYLIQTGEAESINQMYLLFTDGSCPEVNKIVTSYENLKKVTETEERLPLAALHANYVRLGSQLPAVSDYIEEGHLHECFVAMIYSPQDFYVFYAENWNQMETFQKILGNYYLENEKGTRIPPLLRKQHICQGMYCAIFTAKEWHRALITKCNQETGKCRVSLTEFGDDISVNAKELRLLPKQMFSNFWAQAIHCKLRFSDGIQKYLAQLEKIGKSDKVYTTFKGIVYNNKFVINFNKQVHVKEDEYIWEVDMTKITGRAGEFVQVDTDMEGGVGGFLIRELTEKYPIPPSLL